MNTIDWTHICRHYKGLWVALDPDDEQTVVGSGKTLRAAIEEAARNGYEKPLILDVPEEDITFAGGVYHDSGY